MGIAARAMTDAIDGSIDDCSIRYPLIIIILLITITIIRIIMIILIMIIIIIIIMIIIIIIIIVQHRYPLIWYTSYVIE